jgi:DNA-binding CsgD family transcriptional regulator
VQPMALAELSDLINDIYDRAFDPAGWPATLHRICARIEADTAALYLVDYQDPQPRLFAQWGMPDQHVETWRSKFGADVAALHREIAIRSASNPDEPGVYTRLFSPQERADSRIFREWARPLGICDVVSVSLTTTPQRMGLLAATRHDRVGIATDREIALMRLLTPHIRQSVRLSDLLDMQRLETETLKGTIDSLAASVVVVSSGSEILQTNTVARRMLDAGRPLRSLDGRLATGDPESSEVLRLAIARSIAALGAGLESRAATVAVGIMDGRAMFANVLAIGGSRTASRSASDAVALVIVSPADVAATVVLDGLATTYGLTIAERQILQHVALGRGAVEAATAMGISANTAKSHLQQVFRKTGVTRTPELVALLGRLAPMVGPAA